MLCLITGFKHFSKIFSRSLKSKINKNIGPYELSSWFGFPGFLSQINLANLHSIR